MTSHRDRLIRDLIAHDPLIAQTVLGDQGLEAVTDLVANRATESALQLLEALNAPQRAEVLERLPPAAAGRLLLAAPPRRIVIWLHTLPRARQEALVATLPTSAAREVDRILDLTPDSVLLLAEPPLRLRTHWTVAQTRQRLADAGPAGSRLYVEDDLGHLAGYVDLLDLALARDAERLSTLIRPNLHTVPATDVRNSVFERLERSQLPSVPVVDDDGHLLGIVRSSQVLQSVEEAASLDLQTMVGAGRDERALSPAWFAVRKRHGWLQINLLTAFLAASVVGVFEATIAAYTALAVLLPVVAGQSGNAGAQALAVTMRGLALREVGVSGWARVLVKEMRVGLANGLGIALTCGLGVWVWSQSLGLALVISLAMVLSLVIAGIAGAAIPMILMRLGQDPATSSSIVLTTITDVAGFFSFLGIATALISML